MYCSWRVRWGTIWANLVGDIHHNQATLLSIATVNYLGVFLEHKAAVAAFIVSQRGTLPHHASPHAERYEIDSLSSPSEGAPPGPSSPNSSILQNTKNWSGNRQYQELSTMTGFPHTFVRSPIYSLSKKISAMNCHLLRVLSPVISSTSWCLDAWHGQWKPVGPLCHFIGYVYRVQGSTRPTVGLLDSIMISSVQLNIYFSVNWNKIYPACTPIRNFW